MKQDSQSGKDSWIGTGSQILSLFQRLDCLGEVAQLEMGIAQIDPSRDIGRVDRQHFLELSGRLPRFSERQVVRSQIVSSLRGGRRDLNRLLKITAGLLQLAELGIHHTQQAVGGEELGIAGDRLLQCGDRLLILSCLEKL